MTTARLKRVLIADDHILLAEGIAGLLAADFTIVGLVSSGRQLVREAGRLLPDLIILDISMPDLNGIDAAVQIRTFLPDVRLVFVTQQIDPQYLRATLRIGALGYVLKQSAPSELRTALRHALAGKVFISPLVHAAAGFVPSSVLRKDGVGNLTARQREVLQLIAEGNTARKISDILSISPKTVEFHKKALMDQTGLRTIAELTRYAIHHGIISD